MSTDTTMHRWRPRRIAAVGAVLAFSFALPMYAGLRGFFAMDQSIVFDGGYRIYDGQVIYRDFYAPIGPVTLWFQGLLFREFGVNFYAAVLGAALLNVVGTACAISIVRLLFPKDGWVSLVAGACTSVWLYSPFGTLYPEQTAFSLILVGLWTQIIGLSIADRRPGMSSMLSATTGTLVALAILSKQNAGIPVLALIFAVLAVSLAPNWRQLGRHTSTFVLGLALPIGLFAAWLARYSDPAAFMRHAVEIPTQIGAERLWAGGPWGFIKQLLIGKGNEVQRLFLFAWSLFSALAGVLWFRNRQGIADPHRIGLLAAALGVALVGYQNFFSLSSSNGGSNEKPFFGLVAALSLGLVASLARSDWRANEYANTWTLLSRRTLLAALVVAGFASLTFHNATPLLGSLLALIVADSLGLFQEPIEGGFLARLRVKTTPTAARIAMCVVVVYLFLDGTSITLGRQVHDCFLPNGKTSRLAALSHRGDFPHPLAEPRLAGLHWGKTTRSGAAYVSEADLVELISDLKR